MVQPSELVCQASIQARPGLIAARVTNSNEQSDSPHRILTISSILIRPAERFALGAPVAREKAMNDALPHCYKISIYAPNHILLYIFDGP